MKEQNNKNNKDKVNKLNHKDYVESFKEHLISLSKSQNTVRNYVSDVSKYFDSFDEVNRDNVMEYKKLIGDLASTTINCKLSSIKSFNEYLLGEGIVEKIYILKKDFIKVQQKGNPTDVTEKQVKIFLDRVDKKECMYKSRNIALIHLIANTGIRREESTNILLKNIDLDNGEMIVIGKGNKQRTVLLTDKAIQVIKDYLIDRANHKFANSPYLFISERSEKLHKDSVNDIFEKYYTPKCKVKVHSLRHNMATSAIEQGVLTLPELQDQLGHSSVATSGIYAKARKSNIKKKINKLQIG